MLNILRDNYTKPLDPNTGKSLINHSWGELLYHTNRYMKRGTLAENYAIGKLQQRIVSQVQFKLYFLSSLTFTIKKIIKTQINRIMKRTS